MEESIHLSHGIWTSLHTIVSETSPFKKWTSFQLL